MASINVSRYSEDPECATPEGLRAKLMADLLPQVRKMRLQRNECLVATYIKASVTKGGIIIPGATQAEDRYQGKVGLLLATGPDAFEYESVARIVDHAVDVARAIREGNNEPFTDEDEERAGSKAREAMGVPKVGDWVAYRTSETHEVGVAVGDGEHTLVSCRFIDDDSIKMTITDPTILY
jgi:co-chaperonin GroES (HSP10)